MARWMWRSMEPCHTVNRQRVIYTHRKTLLYSKAVRGCVELNMLQNGVAQHGTPSNSLQDATQQSPASTLEVCNHKYLGRLHRLAFQSLTNRATSTAAAVAKAHRKTQTTGRGTELLELDVSSYANTQHSLPNVYPVLVRPQGLTARPFESKHMNTC